eukprot:CAMPEP_0176270112 /NCGR_PEP_ID=MMETSP0121_2-20121125/44534_1 /TAXON_ID=160619 /ORGANISM="Kryptoperidinium foliaceum, Strain CCMP 1326" /LENGTH=386 /DNA_ID=CAMNT_0017610251 /DNA_START=105 /DNA_END=1265 /DNA_ORIENTATION=+
MGSMQKVDSELGRAVREVREAFNRPAWWVLGFGWSLAACAGAVNAVAFRSFGHYVSHATGATTSIALGIEGIADGRHGWDEPGDAIKLLLAFLLGALACGLLIDRNHVHFGESALYGAALVVNAFLLFCSVILFEASRGAVAAASFAACACGLQNAMCTSHLGAVVRTTHVTGTLTDIGSTLGRLTMLSIRTRLRRSPISVLERAEVDVDSKRAMALVPMWLSFSAGTFGGAFLHKHLGVHALLCPACFTFFGGLAYMLFQQRMRLQMQTLERDRLLSDIGTMAATMSTARGAMASAKTHARHCFSPSATMAMGGLQEEFGHMLETMRRAEAQLQDLFSDAMGHELTELPEGGPDEPVDDLCNRQVEAKGAETAATRVAVEVCARE